MRRITVCAWKLRMRAGQTIALMIAAGAMTAARAEPQADAAKKPVALRIEPSNAVLCDGEEVTLRAMRGDAEVEVAWAAIPDVGGGGGGSAASEYTFTAPPRKGTVAMTGRVQITAESADPQQTAAASIELAGACDAPFGGELARFTVGYEQIGAAGIESTQRYAFDVHMSRPLPFWSDRRDAGTFYFGPPLRWWGKVRVGSYPQQVNAEIAKFAAEFVGSAGKVKVNELVRSAEYQTGLEVRLWSAPGPRHAMTEGTQQRFALMAFGGFGGIGPLPPVSDAAVFAVPADDGSPQSTAFKAAYPDIKSPYVAFVPPSSSRFMEQGMVGLRLYTFAVASASRNPQASAPAVVEVSYGRNKLVSNDRRVIHAAAFYPFAFGDRTKPDTVVIYFFGDALMAREPDSQVTPIFLNPALDAEDAAIPLTNPNVTIVPAPNNNRDTYRVGVAIDLLRLWNRLRAPSPE